MKTGKKIDIKKIKNIIYANFPDILFCFVFGSAQNGLIPEGGDLDIAVYTSTNVTLELYNKLSKLIYDGLKIENVDIAILNNADPVLRYEAIKGQLLFSRNKEEYLRFFSITCREYESQIVDYGRQKQYRQSNEIISKSSTL